MCLRLAQRVSKPAGSGGFHAALVRPVEERPATAAQAQVAAGRAGVRNQLDHTAAPHGPSARIADTRGGDGKDAGRHVRLDHAVAAGPAADHVRALGSALTAQLRIK